LTMASPTRYCTKTRRGAGSAERRARTRTENCRHPGGESHALEPRPRPVSWKVARETIGVGRDVRKRGFLGLENLSDGHGHGYGDREYGMWREG
jgi:hypothetical protein